MKISDLLKMCADNLLRRKGRSILTIIGVVVGTCSIVVMISFGVAIDKQQEEMFANMGDLTMIEVYNWGGGGSGSGGAPPSLDDTQLELIAAQPGVQAVSPFYQSRYVTYKMYAGKNDRYYAYAWNIVGVYPDAMEAFGYELVDGQGSYNITYTAGTRKPIPVLFGQYTAYQFMDSRKRDAMIEYYNYTDGNEDEMPDPYFDPLKEPIAMRSEEYDASNKPSNATLNVVGVLMYNGGMYQTHSGVIMDINALRALEEEYLKLNNIKLTADQKKVNYEQVYVKCTSIDMVEEVESYIKDMGYSTWSMTSMRDEMKKSTQTIQLILGSLGAISMFVAALSIANTMTMAIYERTKEIGVMKVLGCKLMNIRTMFLVESGMIGFAGGVVGLSLSYLISLLLNRFLTGLTGGSSLSIIPFWLAGLGLLFSTLVGLGSGIMPANRAVKISALEAIRHE